MATDVEPGASDEEARSTWREAAAALTRSRVGAASVAIAIACEPALLIADEPTTALDVTIQAQILDLFHALRERTRMSLVLITHDLGIVARTTERVAVMYAGRVVETGPTEAVLADPRHPYTQGLLRSIPRLDRARTERLTPIDGSPPDPARLASGCKFAPRCAHKFAKCESDPPLAGGRFPGCRNSHQVLNGYLSSRPSRQGWIC